jgi:hypothetical protein
MKHAFFIALLLTPLAGCSHAREYFTKRFVGAKGLTAQVAVKATSALDLSTAIDKRLLSKGWKPTTPPASWTSAYSHEMRGFIPWLFYQEGNAKASIRYDFTVSESTSAATAQGRCMFLASPDAQPQQSGGSCLVKLDKMFSEVKGQLEQPKTATN